MIFFAEFTLKLCNFFQNLLITDDHWYPKDWSHVPDKLAIKDQSTIIDIYSEKEIDRFFHIPYMPTHYGAKVCR